MKIEVVPRFELWVNLKARVVHLIPPNGSRVLCGKPKHWWDTLESTTVLEVEKKLRPLPDKAPEWTICQDCVATKAFKGAQAAMEMLATSRAAAVRAVIKNPAGDL